MWSSSDLVKTGEKRGLLFPYATTTIWFTDTYTESTVDGMSSILLSYMTLMILFLLSESNITTDP